MKQEDRPTIKVNQTGGYSGETARLGDSSVSPSQPTQALTDYSSQQGPSQQTIILGQPTPAMAWLAIVSGARAGKLFPLDPKGTIVGRDAQNDIVLDDTSVSRQHIKLRKEPGARKSLEQFYLYDLGSANGTWVNDRKVVRVALNDGDKIRIGETDLIFKTVEQQTTAKSKKPAKHTSKAKSKKPAKRASKAKSKKE